MHSTQTLVEIYNTQGLKSQSLARSKSPLYLLTGLRGPVEAGPLAQRCLTVPELEQLGVGESGDCLEESRLSSEEVVDPELTPLELWRTRLGGPACRPRDLLLKINYR